MPGSTQTDTWYKVKLAIALINYQLNQTEQLNPRPGSCASSTVSYAQPPPKPIQASASALPLASPTHKTRPRTLQWGSANPLQLYCVHSPSIKIKENYGFLAYPRVMNKKNILLREQCNRILCRSTETASQNSLCIKIHTWQQSQMQVRGQSGVKAPYRE